MVSGFLVLALFPRVAQLITLLNEFHARICRLEFDKYDMEFEVKKKDFEVHGPSSSVSLSALSTPFFQSPNLQSCQVSTHTTPVLLFRHYLLYLLPLSCNFQWILNYSFASHSLIELIHHLESR